MLLRHRSTFRRLWVGQSVSVIGDGMQRLALLWWGKHHGGNGLLIAIALSTMLPVVLGSPVGGWLADRRDRRSLLLGADAARLVTSVLLAALLLGHTPNRVLVCLLVAVAGIATATFDPAYAASVPSIVDDADLPPANGLNLAQGAVGGIAGPLLGGVLIGATDVGWVMVVNAATFLWSAACVAGCRLPRPATEDAAAGTTGERRRGIARDAWGVVRSVPGLGRLVVLASILNMVVAPVPMLIAALAIDRFRAGPRTFGLLEVLLSAGLLVGSLLAGKLAGGRLVGSFLVLGACLGVVGALLFGGAAAALVVGGVAIAVANTEAITLFQRAVPGSLHGRVFGVLGSLSEGLRPAGLALAAPLLAVAGVTGAFVAVGASVVLATLAVAGGLPSTVPDADPVGDGPVGGEVRVAGQRSVLRRRRPARSMASATSSSISAE